MLTLIIDGAWALKKNFFKRKDLVSNGEQCGGSFGFIDSLRSVMNRVLPDRVVVLWDGKNAGILRYEIYKPYKSNRNKKWDQEQRAIDSEIQETDDDKEKVELLKQKIVVKNYLENLFIRQAEVDLIEADDLIALYVLSSTIPDEKIIIHSRDKDFHQLISPKVSILTPDSLELITHENFLSKFGYVLDNALLMKCFDGDSADVIKGVNGVSKDKLLEFFPRLAKEKIYYNKMVEEAYDKKLKHKIKFYDKIIEARNVLYRNAKLMDLKRPFINEEAKREIYNAIYPALSEEDRSIKTAITEFIKNGYSKFVGQDHLDIFFSAFYRIMNKEMEYKKTL